MQLKNNYILIILSAFLTGLSQHNQILGFIAWFSIIPLIFVLKNITSYRDVLRYSFLWGFIYNLTTVFWIAFNIGTNIYAATLSMFATVFILSFNIIFISTLWYYINKKYENYSLFIFPVIWVSIEYIRSYGILGFPWVNIANSQTIFFNLIQNAEYVGIYGVSFWVLLINVLLYNVINYFSKRNLFLLILLFALPFISGNYLFNRLEENKVDNYQISIIQPNINLIDKRDYSFTKKNLNNLINISNKCIYEGSNLIIWPESAMPYQNIQDPKILEYITSNLLNENNAHLITGNVIYEGSDVYNSIVLINKDGIKEVYHKQQLVPMGEYVPFSDKFDILSKINLGQANFSSGTEDVIFEVNNEKFSSMICFESTFPEINRRHALKGADFFIYAVNDGWYTTLPEPRQHARQSIFRAIENRNTVLRCANTGLSLIIDPSGYVREQSLLNTEEVITTFIRKANKITFYTLYGNVFAYFMLTITCILLLLSIFRNEKKN